MSRAWPHALVALAATLAALAPAARAQPPAPAKAPPDAPVLPPPRREDGKAAELPPPRAAPRDELRLGEVLASVDRHYPLLLAVLQEQGIASGQLLAAQGAFDLNLRGREFWQVGTFDSHRINLGVDQNLAWNGVSYFTGYRQSVGQFPIYYGDRKTGEGGEARAGVLIPLLAGREIDPRRARLMQAEITRRIADPVIAAQRIDVLRAAARAYWTWAGVGRRVRIARSVLEIAERRDRQLDELVRRGAVNEIEKIDNQRVVIERRARLVVAERALQQATIALSLYLRDPTGHPILPPESYLPQSLPEAFPLDPQRVAKDIEVALSGRPELTRLRLQRERVAVERELAKNQMLPGLNLGLEGYQDFGFGSNFSKTPLVKGTQLDRSTYIASLQFDLPLQRRDARGRIQAAEAQLAQLFEQERFQRDRVVAEVQDAASNLQQSYRLLQEARQGLGVAQKVETAETERFRLGQVTVLILNLRELVTAEAAFAEVDALAEYHRAQADYRAAMGLDGQVPGAHAGPGIELKRLEILPE